MKGHAQRVKISQQKALCFKDQVGCKGWWLEIQPTEAGEQERAENLLHL